MASAAPSNPDALTDLVGRGATGLAVLTAALLLLAVLGEVLRRRHRAGRALAVIDALVPGAARAIAVSLVGLVSAAGVTRPAGADDSVRGWLGRPTPTSTIAGPVAGPVVTPDALDALTATSTTTTTTSTTVPIGPPVLVPSTPSPTMPAATPSPPPRPAPAPVPAPPVVGSPTPPPELPAYVVRRGDCLWSIAASRLGPGADARAIDAGWRRIYVENRAAVGDDPNLIHPGLVLRLPPLDVQP